MKLALFAAPFVLAMAHGVTAQAIRYVDDDAAPGGDGLSWATAWNDLAGAMTTLRAVELHIAAGTYTPGTSNTDTFSLRSGLHLIGGFGGETILSGEISSDPLGDCLTVVTASGGILENVTIADGQGFYTDGAGMMITGGAPDIRGCHFTNNMTNFRGTIAVRGGALPTFDGCTFQGNHAHWTGSGIDIEGAGAVITDCTFEPQASEYGPGVYVGNGWASIARCTFIGQLITDAGTVFAFNSRIGVSDCSFIECRASTFGGAAIAAYGASVMRVNDSTFIGNVCDSIATGHGSVVMARDQSRVTIMGSELKDNSEPEFEAQDQAIVTVIP
jgi:hypothetical protein